MPDLLSYLIRNCLHDPKGDHKTDVSTLELETKFDPLQLNFLKDKELLEKAPVPSFLRCSECGRSCTVSIIKVAGKYFLPCEQDSTRRVLEPLEVERWQLSLRKFCQFIATSLESSYIGKQTESGTELCLANGYSFKLFKKGFEWFLVIETVSMLATDLFFWKGNSYQLNRNKLNSALQGLSEYNKPQIKWTQVKLQELVDRKAAIQRSNPSSFLKELASEYGVSKQAIQKQLKKAEGQGLKPQTATPFQGLLKKQ